MIRHAIDTLERHALAAVCRVAGHAPSWVRAVAEGRTDRPVCNRCGTPL